MSSHTNFVPCRKSASATTSGHKRPLLQNATCWPLDEHFLNVRKIPIGERLSSRSRIKTYIDEVKDKVQKPPGTVPASFYPSWQNIPLEKKIPRIPAPAGALVYARGCLGTKLHRRPKTFSVHDPNHRESVITDYDSLHDPYAQSYYCKPEIQALLLKQGLVTRDGQVVCSQREFNRYREYLRTIYSQCLEECIKEDDDKFKEGHQQSRDLKFYTETVGPGGKHDREEIKRCRMLQHKRRKRDEDSKKVKQKQRKEDCRRNVYARAQFLQKLNRAMISCENNLRRRINQVNIEQHKKFQEERFFKCVREKDAFYQERVQFLKDEMARQYKLCLTEWALAKCTYQVAHLKHEENVRKSLQHDRRRRIAKRRNHFERLQEREVLGITRSIRKKCREETETCNARIQFLARKYFDIWCQHVKSKKVLCNDVDGSYRTVWDVTNAMRTMNNYLLRTCNKLDTLESQEDQEEEEEKRDSEEIASKIRFSTGNNKTIGYLNSNNSPRRVSMQQPQSAPPKALGNTSLHSSTSLLPELQGKQTKTPENKPKRAKSSPRCEDMSACRFFQPCRRSKIYEITCGGCYPLERWRSTDCDKVNHQTLATVPCCFPRNPCTVCYEEPCSPCRTAKPISACTTPEGICFESRCIQYLQREYMTDATKCDAKAAAKSSVKRPILKQKTCFNKVTTPTGQCTPVSSKLVRDLNKPCKKRPRKRTCRTIPPTKDEPTCPPVRTGYLSKKCQVPSISSHPLFKTGSVREYFTQTKPKINKIRPRVAMKDTGKKACKNSYKEPKRTSTPVNKLEQISAHIQKPKRKPQPRRLAGVRITTASQTDPKKSDTTFSQTPAIIPRTAQTNEAPDVSTNTTQTDKSPNTLPKASQTALTTLKQNDTQTDKPAKVAPQQTQSVVEAIPQPAQTDNSKADAVSSQTRSEITFSPKPTQTEPTKASETPIQTEKNTTVKVYPETSPKDPKTPNRTPNSSQTNTIVFSPETTQTKTKVPVFQPVQTKSVSFRSSFEQTDRYELNSTPAQTESVPSGVFPQTTQTPGQRTATLQPHAQQTIIANSFVEVQTERPQFIPEQVQTERPQFIPEPVQTERPQFIPEPVQTDKLRHSPRSSQTNPPLSFTPKLVQTDSINVTTGVTQIDTPNIDTTPKKTQTESLKGPDPKPAEAQTDKPPESTVKPTQTPSRESKQIVTQTPIEENPNTTESHVQPEPRSTVAIPSQTKSNQSISQNSQTIPAQTAPEKVQTELIVISSISVQVQHSPSVTQTSQSDPANLAATGSQVDPEPKDISPINIVRTQTVSAPLVTQENQMGPQDTTPKITQTELPVTTAGFNQTHLDVNKAGTAQTDTPTELPQDELLETTPRDTQTDALNVTSSTTETVSRGARQSVVQTERIQAHTEVVQTAPFQHSNVDVQTVLTVTRVNYAQPEPFSSTLFDTAIQTEPIELTPPTWQANVEVEARDSIAEQTDPVSVIHQPVQTRSVVPKNYDMNIQTCNDPNNQTIQTIAPCISVIHCQTNVPICLSSSQTEKYPQRTATPAVTQSVIPLRTPSFTQTDCINVCTGNEQTQPQTPCCSSVQTIVKTRLNFTEDEPLSQSTTGVQTKRHDQKQAVVQFDPETCDPSAVQTDHMPMTDNFVKTLLPVSAAPCNSQTDNQTCYTPPSKSTGECQFLEVPCAVQCLQTELKLLSEKCDQVNSQAKIEDCSQTPCPPGSVHRGQQIEPLTMVCVQTCNEIRNTNDGQTELPVPANQCAQTATKSANTAQSQTTACTPSMVDICTKTHCSKSQNIIQPDQPTSKSYSQTDHDTTAATSTATQMLNPTTKEAYQGSVLELCPDQAVQTILSPKSERLCQTYDEPICETQLQTNPPPVRICVQTGPDLNLQNMGVSQTYSSKCVHILTHVCPPCLQENSDQTEIMFSETSAQTEKPNDEAAIAQTEQAVENSSQLGKPCQIDEGSQRSVLNEALSIQTDAPPGIEQQSQNDVACVEQETAQTCQPSQGDRYAQTELISASGQTEQVTGCEGIVQTQSLRPVPGCAQTILPCVQLVIQSVQTCLPCHVQANAQTLKCVQDLASVQTDEVAPCTEEQSQTIKYCPDVGGSQTVSAPISQDVVQTESNDETTETEVTLSVLEAVQTEKPESQEIAAQFEGQAEDCSQTPPPPASVQCGQGNEPLKLICVQTCNATLNTNFCQTKCTAIVDQCFQTDKKLPCTSESQTQICRTPMINMYTNPCCLQSQHIIQTDSPTSKSCANTEPEVVTVKCISTQITPLTKEASENSVPVVCPEQSVQTGLLRKLENTFSCQTICVPPCETQNQTEPPATKICTETDPAPVLMTSTSAQMIIPTKEAAQNPSPPAPTQQCVQAIPDQKPGHYSQTLEPIPCLEYTQTDLQKPKICTEINTEAPPTVKSTPTQMLIAKTEACSETIPAQPAVQCIQTCPSPRPAIDSQTCGPCCLVCVQTEASAKPVICCQTCGQPDRSQLSQTIVPATKVCAHTEPASIPLKSTSTQLLNRTKDNEQSPDTIAPMDQCDQTTPIPKPASTCQTCDPICCIVCAQTELASNKLCAETQSDLASKSCPTQIEFSTKEISQGQEPKVLSEQGHQTEIRKSQPAIDTQTCKPPCCVQVIQTLASPLPVIQCQTCLTCCIEATQTDQSPNKKSVPTQPVPPDTVCTPSQVTTPTQEFSQGSMLPVPIDHCVQTCLTSNPTIAVQTCKPQCTIQGTESSPGSQEVCYQTESNSKAELCSQTEKPANSSEVAQTVDTNTDFSSQMDKPCTAEQLLQTSFPNTKGGDAQTNAKSNLEQFSQNEPLTMPDGTSQTCPSSAEPAFAQTESFTLGDQTEVISGRDEFAQTQPPCPEQVCTQTLSPCVVVCCVETIRPCHVQSNVQTPEALGCINQTQTHIAPVLENYTQIGKPSTHEQFLQTVCPNLTEENVQTEYNNETTETTPTQESDGYVQTDTQTPKDALTQSHDNSSKDAQTSPIILAEECTQKEELAVDNIEQTGPPDITEQCAQTERNEECAQTDNEVTGEISFQTEHRCPDEAVTQTTDPDCVGRSDQTNELATQEDFTQMVTPSPNEYFTQTCSPEVLENHAQAEFINSECLQTESPCGTPACSQTCPRLQIIQCVQTIIPCPVHGNSQTPNPVSIPCYVQAQALPSEGYAQTTPESLPDQCVQTCPPLIAEECAQTEIRVKCEQTEKGPELNVSAQTERVCPIDTSHQTLEPTYDIQCSQTEYCPEDKQAETTEIINDTQCAQTEVTPCAEKSEQSEPPCPSEVITQTCSPESAPESSQTLSNNLCSQTLTIPGSEASAQTDSKSEVCEQTCPPEIAEICAQTYAHTNCSQTEPVSSLEHTTQASPYSAEGTSQTLKPPDIFHFAQTTQKGTTEQATLITQPMVADAFVQGEYESKCLQTEPVCAAESPSQTYPTLGTDQSHQTCAAEVVDASGQLEFNSECCQTEIPLITIEALTQTELPKPCVGFSQTCPTCYLIRCTQTCIKSYAECFTQTPNACPAEKVVQTEQASLLENCTQTVPKEHVLHCVQTKPPFPHGQLSQTDPAPKAETSIQTVLINKTGASTQSNDEVEESSQTEKPGLSEESPQTDIPIPSSLFVQTECIPAEQCCQTVVTTVALSCCQTEIAPRVEVCHETDTPTFAEICTVTETFPKSRQVTQSEPPLAGTICTQVIVPDTCTQTHHNSVIVHCAQTVPPIGTNMFSQSSPAKEAWAQGNETRDTRPIRVQTCKSLPFDCCKSIQTSKLHPSKNIAVECCQHIHTKLNSCQANTHLPNTTCCSMQTYCCKPKTISVVCSCPDIRSMKNMETNVNPSVPCCSSMQTPPCWKPKTFSVVCASSLPNKNQKVIDIQTCPITCCTTIQTPICRKPKTTSILSGNSHPCQPTMERVIQTLASNPTCYTSNQTSVYSNAKSGAMDIQTWAINPTCCSSLQTSICCKPKSVSNDYGNQPPHLPDTPACPKTETKTNDYNRRLPKGQTMSTILEAQPVNPSVRCKWMKTAIFDPSNTGSSSVQATKCNQATTPTLITMNCKYAQLPVPNKSNQISSDKHTNSKLNDTETSTSEIKTYTRSNQEPSSCNSFPKQCTCCSSQQETILQDIPCTCIPEIVCSTQQQTVHIPCQNFSTQSPAETCPTVRYPNATQLQHLMHRTMRNLLTPRDCVTTSNDRNIALTRKCQEEDRFVHVTPPANILAETVVLKALSGCPDRVTKEFQAGTPAVTSNVVEDIVIQSSQISIVGDILTERAVLRVVKAEGANKLEKQRQDRATSPLSPAEAIVYSNCLEESEHGFVQGYKENQRPDIESVSDKLSKIKTQLTTLKENLAKEGIGNLQVLENTSLTEVPIIPESDDASLSVNLEISELNSAESSNIPSTHPRNSILKSNKPTPGSSKCPLNVFKKSLNLSSTRKVRILEKKSDLKQEAVPEVDSTLRTTLSESSNSVHPIQKSFSEKSSYLEQTVSPIVHANDSSRALFGRPLEPADSPKGRSMIPSTKSLGFDVSDGPNASQSSTQVLMRPNENMIESQSAQLIPEEREDQEVLKTWVETVDAEKKKKLEIQERLKNVRDQVDMTREELERRGIIEHSGPKNKKQYHTKKEKKK